VLAGMRVKAKANVKENESDNEREIETRENIEEVKERPNERE